MGSLLKGPKPPSTPTTTVTTVTPTTPVVETETDTSTPSEQQAEARRQSLLRRSRGRLGTIISGFSGVLSPQDNDQSSGRKTLLGE